jgi:hypothetical protein
MEKRELIHLSEVYCLPLFKLHAQRRCITPDPKDGKEEASFLYFARLDGLWIVGYQGEDGVPR